MWVFALRLKKRAIVKYNMDGFRFNLNYRCKTEWYIKDQFHIEVLYFVNNERVRGRFYTETITTDETYTYCNYRSDSGQTKDNIEISVNFIPQPNKRPVNEISAIEYFRDHKDADDAWYGYELSHLKNPKDYPSRLIRTLISDEHCQELFELTGNYEYLYKGNNQVPIKYQNILEFDREREYRKLSNTKYWNKHKDRLNEHRRLWYIERMKRENANRKLLEEILSH